MLLYAIALIVAYYLYDNYVVKRRGLPPGPTPMPIFGNIFHLDKVYPERTIENWSKQYGPVLTVWLPKPVICVTDYELIKEYFIKKGDLFVGRPASFVTAAFTDNFAGLIFSFGNRWKEQRRFAINTLRNFGFGRNIMEQKVMLEAHWLADQIEATKERVFDPWDAIELAVSNVIVNVLLGHRYEQNEPRYIRLKESMDTLVREFENPTARMVDSWPYLRFLPKFSTGVKAVVDARCEINNVLAEFIQEHKQNFDPKRESEDFVSAYMGEIHRREKAGEDLGHFNERQLIVATADLMGAGMETTVTTLRWGILYLMHYPEVQSKAHQELDEVIGPHAEVTMADRTRLPYNSAVMQEIQRLSNILPINLFHTPTQDITINGHFIKEGTVMLPQIGNVMTDPHIFPNPEKFDPTRYLNANGTAKKVEELVPFSIGKRQCLGESLARAELFLMYATMMQKFRFAPAPAGLPTLTPMVAFVRKPVHFECVALKRH